MRYEGLLIKRKQDTSLRLFSCEVKRWFILDTTEGFFAYCKKEGKAIKRSYPI